METTNNNEEVPSAAVSEEKKLKLHELAKQGDLEAMKAAVGGGEREWNAVDKSRMNLLHVAAMNGQESVVGWLLSETGGRAAGFEHSVLAKHSAAMNAMQLAAKYGHLQCIQALLEGCNVENGEREELLNGLFNDGSTLLHFASFYGRVTILQWLLSDCGGRAAGFQHSVLVKTKEGMTALHLAAGTGHLECVQALIEGCKNGERELLLNNVSKSGWTVLHLAALRGHASIITWLLSDSGGRAAGFQHSVLAKTKEGNIALHLAAWEGHLQCMQALVEGCKVENGERDKMINDTDKDGSTLLHIASLYGHIVILQWLLSDCGGRAAGFQHSVLVKTKEGSTALHLAAEKGHLECVQAVIEGCKIEEQNQLINSVSDDNWTLLHKMVSFNQVAVLQWLLSDSGGRAAGFQQSVLVKTKEGMTALHLAVHKGHLQCVQALIEGCKIEEREALLNDVSKNGSTVLHLAAFHGHASIIRWLLSDSGGRAAGFRNIVGKNNKGMTSFDIAAQKGNLECVQAVIEGCKIEEQNQLINSVSDNNWTMLHKMVSFNQVTVLQWLLSDSGGRAAGFQNVLAKTKEGRTALHFAVHKGHLQCVQALIEGCKIEEREALLNDVSKNGSTVLHLAAFHGHASIIRWLLSDSGGRAAGFRNIVGKNNKGMTSFDIAAQKGNLECVQAVIEGCKIEEQNQLINSVSDNNWTMLHKMVSFNQVAVLQWLLSDSGGRAAGFKNVLAKTKEGRTALHLAAWKGHLQCVQALIEGCKIEEREALLNDVTNIGSTVLHLAAFYGRTSIIRWLLSDCGGRAAGFQHSVLAKAREGSTALHVAVQKGSLQCVEALVEGCKIEEKEKLLNKGSDSCATVLHFAANEGHESIIRWLLSDFEGRAAGFNKVLSKDSDGCNALHLAAEKGHLACVQAVVEGCKVENGERAKMINEIDNGEWTALHYAAAEGHASVITWLLSNAGGRGAEFSSVLSKDNEGTNALLLAAEQGRLECAQALVDGCRAENGERAKMMNDVDNEKWTALHCAASNGQASIITWLLSNCGGRAAGFNNILSKESKGNTALHVAAWKGHLECIQAIVDGCKVENGERTRMINDVSNEKWTALHHAAFYGHSSIITWLLSESGGRAAGFHGVLSKDSDGMTALRHAAGEGHLDCIQALVEGCKHSAHREKLLNDFDAVAGSILHEAAYRGRPSIITWLLSEKGRAAGFKLGVLEKDGDGKTALHDAAEEGHLSCIEALAEGCKTHPEEQRQLLNAKNNDGWTALHSAAASQDPSTMSWFLSDSGGRAAGFGVTKIATTLNDMRSILHSSVQNGKVQALHHLLSGCTPSERLTLLHPQDKQHGWTVLHEAARFGKADVIRELMCYAETQSITSIRDHRGLSALHRAVIGGVDGKSRAEWAEGVFVPFDRAEVVSALLSMVQDKEEDDDETKKNKKRKREGEEEEEVPLMDVNLGIQLF